MSNEERFSQLETSILELRSDFEKEKEESAVERQSLLQRQSIERKRLRKLFSFASIIAIASVASFASTLSEENLILWGFNAERLTSKLDWMATILFALAASIYAGKPGQALADWLDKNG